MVPPQNHPAKESPLCWDVSVIGFCLDQLSRPHGLPTQECYGSLESKRLMEAWVCLFPCLFVCLFVLLCCTQKWGSPKEDATTLAFTNPCICAGGYGHKCDGHSLKAWRHGNLKSHLLEQWKLTELFRLIRRTKHPERAPSGSS